jgi:hypothetical protein
VRVSPASVSGVDLTAVTGVDVQGVSQDGRVWLLDVAAASASLPPVPAKRLATLDLGDVRVTEGDGPGSRLMHVPYRVFGRLSAPARVVLTSFDTETSRWGRPTYADLPAGTTAGTIALPYTPDDLDDRRVQVRELTVYPVFGIMTRDATASARIMDDDPSPRVRVERVKMSVREGTSARWRVTLSAPVDFAVDVSARVVRGRKPLPRVRVSDVGVAFRKDYIDPSVPVDTPLHKMEVFVGRTIAPGRRSVTVSVPLRRDGVSEPREAITMQVRMHGVRVSPVERTIVVRDR